MVVSLLAAVLCTSPLAADREWDALTATATARAKLIEAGQRLGKGRINLAGRWITGSDLIALGRTDPREPLTRAMREAFRRPVDVDDFLLFADDLVHDGRDLQKEPAFLPAGRARRIGVLLHPNDVFRNRPRLYATTSTAVWLEEPTTQIGLPPAKDGDPISPNWAARYQQPDTERGRMAALKAANPGLAERITRLMSQLKKQGAMVYVESTLRPRERGLLLYGAFVLSRSASRAEVAKQVAELESFNQDWGLNVPIRWRHPDGWQATVDAAQALAETFGVVYATKRGAQSSDHYDGSAIDLFVVNLPRKLTLCAPDGAILNADLSGPDESRDLNLTPRLIEWIETHFQLAKLRKDYPHWTDARPKPEPKANPGVTVPARTTIRRASPPKP